MGPRLDLAGLEADQRPPRKVVAAGPVELLERAYEAFGTQLTVDEVDAFAKANGIRYAKERKRKWSAIVAEWKRRTPQARPPSSQGSPPRSERPDYTVDVGAARDGERPFNKWSRDSCVAVLVQYVEQMPPGQRAGARQYRVWARDQPRAPYDVTIRKHGGWSKLLGLAHEEIMRRRAGGPTGS